jgi:hypothetical protein
MNKWTWLIIAAIALAGGGYYLSSYQKSKEVAPAPLEPGLLQGGEDFDGSEDSAELDKEAAEFEGAEQDPSAAPEANIQGLGLGGQEGSTAADVETLEDHEEPAGGPKDRAPDLSPPAASDLSKPLKSESLSR